MLITNSTIKQLLRRTPARAAGPAYSGWARGGAPDKILRRKHLWDPMLYSGSPPLLNSKSDILDLSAENGNHIPRVQLPDIKTKTKTKTNNHHNNTKTKTKTKTKTSTRASTRLGPVARHRLLAPLPVDVALGVVRLGHCDVVCLLVVSLLVV